MTADRWRHLTADGVLSDSLELQRLTYYGGVSPELRKHVWPYLLGHYPFGSTREQREAQDQAVQTAYETTMSEWLAVEAIIRQRDKEVTAASIAKLSCGSAHQPQHQHQQHQQHHQQQQQQQHQQGHLLSRQSRSFSNEVGPTFDLIFTWIILWLSIY